MKVELKNIQYVASMSEETHCFTASLYVDGVKRGTVSNRGYGGSTDFTDWGAMEELDAYGKTLPKIVRPFGEFDHDAESFVNDALEAYIAEKELTNKLRRRVLFLQGGKVWESRAVSKEDLPHYIAHYAKDPTKTVLNTMPKPEAVRAYLAAFA